MSTRSRRRRGIGGGGGEIQFDIFPKAKLAVSPYLRIETLGTVGKMAMADNVKWQNEQTLPIK